jgi:RNA polymerase sigma-70 factor (ECF subfamily)
MGDPNPDNSDGTAKRVAEALRGDGAPLGELLERHKDRLRRMVALRLDHRLQGRVDPSDVLQEAFLEATVRLPEYASSQATMPFFLWLRLIVGQRLLILHRRHLGARARDAGGEVSLCHGATPEASSAALAAQLLGRDTRPSEAAVRAERKLRLEAALSAMEPLDREVLALRHFERLSTTEAARILSISEAAAGQRHFRALKRLRDLLSSLPGGIEELGP